MSSEPRLLYLSRASVEQAGLSLAEVEAAVEHAFRAKAQGETTLPPKVGFRPTSAAPTSCRCPGPSTSRPWRKSNG